jgi:hypothetical protein
MAQQDPERPWGEKRRSSRIVTYGVAAIFCLGVAMAAALGWMGTYTVGGLIIGAAGFVFFLIRVVAEVRAGSSGGS